MDSDGESVDHDECAEQVPEDEDEDEDEGGGEGEGEGEGDEGEGEGEGDEGEGDEGEGDEGDEGEGDEGEKYEGDAAQQPAPGPSDTSKRKRAEPNTQRWWKPDNWPLFTNVVCFNCSHPVPEDIVPLVMPVRYDRAVNTWHCRGVFCTWSCMLRFQRENYQAETPIKEYINVMYRFLHGTPPEALQPAPPRHRLTMYGGDLTIDEYRSINEGYGIPGLEKMLRESESASASRRKEIQDELDAKSPDERLRMRHRHAVDREARAIEGDMVRRGRKVTPKESLEIRRAVEKRMRPPQITVAKGFGSVKGSIVRLDGIVTEDDRKKAAAIDMVRNSQKPVGEERMRLKRLKLERSKPFQPGSQKTLQNFFTSS